MISYLPLPRFFRYYASPKLAQPHSMTNSVQAGCSTEGCSEARVACLDDRHLCYRHFLDYVYSRLEEISQQIHDRQFLEHHAQDPAVFLEDCMRDAADIACLVPPPGNLERARVLDVLLWASELHSRLRRSPRVPAHIDVLLRSEEGTAGWEEKTVTQVVSRHGAQLVCRRECKRGEILTCTRLDTGARGQARVVWCRRRGAGDHEVGIEFLTDVNFWNLGKSGMTPLLTPPGRP